MSADRPRKPAGEQHIGSVAAGQGSAAGFFSHSPVHINNLDAAPPRQDLVDHILGSSEHHAFDIFFWIDDEERTVEREVRDRIALLRDQRLPAQTVTALIKGMAARPNGAALCAEHLWGMREDRLVQVFRPLPRQHRRRIATAMAMILATFPEPERARHVLQALAKEWDQLGAYLIEHVAMALGDLDAGLGRTIDLLAGADLGFLARMSTEAVATEILFALPNRRDTFLILASHHDWAAHHVSRAPVRAAWVLAEVSELEAAPLLETLPAKAAALVLRGLGPDRAARQVEVTAAEQALAIFQQLANDPFARPLFERVAKAAPALATTVLERLTPQAAAGLLRVAHFETAAEVASSLDSERRRTLLNALPSGLSAAIEYRAAEIAGDSECLAGLVRRPVAWPRLYAVRTALTVLPALVSRVVDPIGDTRSAALLAAPGHVASLWRASRRSVVGDPGRRRLYVAAAAAFVAGLVVASIVDLGGQEASTAEPGTTLPAAQPATDPGRGPVGSALPLTLLASHWSADCPGWRTEIGIRTAGGGADAMALFRLECNLAPQRGTAGMTVACVQYPVEHPFFGRPNPRTDERGGQRQGSWRHSDGRSGKYIEYYRDLPTDTSPGRAAIWLETTINGYPVALIVAAPPQSGDLSDQLRLVVGDHKYVLASE
jgi:hypothetical protein